MLLEAVVGRQLPGGIFAMSGKKTRPFIFGGRRADAAPQGAPQRVPAAGPRTPPPTSPAPTPPPPTPPKMQAGKPFFPEFINNVQHLAEAGIGTTKKVKQYNQTAYLPKPQEGAYSAEMKEGYCDAICLQWMKWTSEEKNFWSFVTTEAGVSETINLQAQSNQYKKAHAAVSKFRGPKIKEVENTSKRSDFQEVF